MSFRVSLGDIAEVRSDAAVNFLYVDGHPDNRSNVCKSFLLHLGQPGDAAYDHYVAHIDALPLKLGLEPDISAVKGLFVPYLINAVVPKKEMDTARYDGVYQRLYSVFHSVYLAAVKKGFKHLAIPPLGSGTICHYHGSESMQAARMAAFDFDDKLDIQFVIFYQATKFQELLEHLPQEDRQRFAERGWRHNVHPDYYSAHSVLDKLNAYTHEKYQVDDFYKDPDLKERVCTFVYNNTDSTLRANKKKLSDPHQTISGRTLWLFACALRMSLWEFKEIMTYVNPNPPLTEEEKNLAFASLNWGLADDEEVLAKAYLAMIGKPLFK
jgi:prepilin-type processing-associated H-X9-DG protein